MIQQQSSCSSRRNKTICNCTTLPCCSQMDNNDQILIHIFVLYDNVSNVMVLLYDMYDKVAKVMVWETKKEGGGT